MTPSNHSEKLLQAYKDGRLNDYMYNRLMKVIDSGMTDDLLGETVEDAQCASDHGVSGDKDYHAYFFIQHLTDDILDDTFGVKLNDVDKKDLISFLFAHRNDETYKLNNLVDYRLLVHKWLCSRLSKKAYPNTMGKNNRDPVCDLDKWISTLKNIYGLIHAPKGPKLEQISRGAAIDYFTAQWDPDETQKFINWMRYYEDGSTEKYNVKTAMTTLMSEAELEIPLPQSWARRDGRNQSGPNMSTFVAPQKTRRELEFEMAAKKKHQMLSRLDSLKRLLRGFSETISKNDLTAIYDEIHKLELSINKLEITASIQDCAIRSAGKLRKLGFSEGAEILEKAAAEPIASPDVMKALPQGVSDQPNMAPGQSNTYSLNTIINRLEGTSKILKTRDIIRELASIDILLNELGLASYFPELTDGQSHLIEAFGYASNKIEAIIAKLRGSGTNKPKPPETKQPEAPMPSAQPPAPPKKPMETGEIMDKPVGEVKKELPKPTPAPIAPPAPKKV
jgi:hypothetical protein